VVLERVEKISWTHHVRNKEVLHRVMKERNVVQTISIGKAGWIGYVLRRNCLLQHVVKGNKEGMIGVTGRRRRKPKQLLDGLREGEVTGN
jgi:hypothetical protein